MTDGKVKEVPEGATVEGQDGPVNGQAVQEMRNLVEVKFSLMRKILPEDNQNQGFS
jgi:hypothetical protein